MRCYIFHARLPSEIEQFKGGLMNYLTVPFSLTRKMYENLGRLVNQVPPQCVKAEFIIILEILDSSGKVGKQTKYESYIALMHHHK